MIKLIDFIAFFVFLAIAMLPLDAYADIYTTDVQIETIEVMNNGNFWIVAKNKSNSSGCYESGKQF